MEEIRCQRMDNMISLEEIESNYLSDSPTHFNLQNINLRVAPFEKIAVMGKPNSGKTALLRCINFIDQPRTGIVQFEQMNLTILSKKELNATRKNIGYVNQERTLINSKSIFNNVALPLKVAKLPNVEIMAKTSEALNMVKLIEKSNLRPQALSDIQKALVCIARAIVTKPKVLICDEISKGLDVKSSYYLINILQNIQKKYNLALIIASNDLELVKTLCDKVVIMDKGKIVEQNTTSNFIMKPESNVGKELIKAKSRIELPSGIRKKLKTDKNFNSDNCFVIARCTFTNKINTELIFSEIIEKFNNKINIISAHQEIFYNTNINIMYIEFSGSEQSVLKSLSLLNENDIYSEVLGYVA